MFEYTIADVIISIVFIENKIIEDVNQMDNTEILNMPAEATIGFIDQKQQSLKRNVEDALQNYFGKLGDMMIKNLYWVVLAEIEEPLLKAVMRYTRDNQSKAAILLGLSRGTLRKKLKNYGMID